jgi:plastocyanin
MLRKSLVPVLLLGIAAAVATGAFGGQRTATTTPTLNATVGPGFTITLKKNGKAVKSLKAGSYKFVVSDKATIHAFALDGPKLEKDFTTVPFTGTKTVTLKLKAGKYKFYCPPHESTMFGRFTVT